MSPTPDRPDPLPAPAAPPDVPSPVKPDPPAVEPSVEEPPGRVHETSDGDRVVRWRLDEGLCEVDGQTRPFTPAETAWADRVRCVQDRADTEAALRQRLSLALTDDPTLPGSVRDLIRLVLGGDALDEET